MYNKKDCGTGLLHSQSSSRYKIKRT